MNILECYIEEIYSEEPYVPKQENMSTLLLDEYVKVKYKYTCYGSSNVTEDIFTKEEWEEIKKKGYYMG